MAEALGLVDLPSREDIAREQFAPTINAVVAAELRFWAGMLNHTHGDSVQQMMRERADELDPPT